MEFTGKCPITMKEETIYCEALNWTNLGRESGYYVGRMYACSVDPRGYNLCNDCPINLNKNNK